MKRITFDGNFCEIAQCRELPCPYRNNCMQKQVWERLRGYEDTGLSPQACAEAREIEETLSGCDYSISRMVELMKADKDGRVIILPCKVYETDGVRVYEHTVREVIYETAGGPAFDKNAIGKSIFLTRAEAEKALQEMEGKG
jgi:hypothetical protein|nr:MAG TPA: hypothetical protein [Caudoviricetes sp.]